MTRHSIIRQRSLLRRRCSAQRRPPRFIHLATLGFVALGLSAAFVGCSDDDNPTGPLITGANVDLQLVHQVDGVDLQLDAVEYDHPTGGYTYNVSTLEYFISGITFTAEDGSTWSPNAATNFYYHRVDDTLSPKEATQRIEGLPAGAYTKISLMFGLPPTLNVWPDLGPGPNDSYNGMHWPVGEVEGYHYMRFEGRFDGGKGFAAHTGRLVQGGVQQSGPITYTLDLDFTVGENDLVTIPLIMNLNQWWQDPGNFDLNAWFPGMIMGNPAAQSALEANGATIYILGTVTVDSD